jgi:hypothetical protein
MKIKPLLILLAIAILTIGLSIHSCRLSVKQLNSTNEYLALCENNFKKYKEVAEADAIIASEKITELESIASKKDLEIKRLAGRPMPKPIYVNIEKWKHDTITKRDSFYYESSPELPPAIIPYVWEDRWNSFQAFEEDGTIGLLYGITDSISVTLEGPIGLISNSNPSVRLIGSTQFEVPVKEKVGWLKRLWRKLKK